MPVDSTANDLLNEPDLAILELHRSENEDSHPERLVDKLGKLLDAMGAVPEKPFALLFWGQAFSVPDCRNLFVVGPILLVSLAQLFQGRLVPGNTPFGVFLACGQLGDKILQLLLVLLRHNPTPVYVLRKLGGRLLFPRFLVAWTVFVPVVYTLVVVSERLWVSIECTDLQLGACQLALPLAFKSLDCFFYEGSSPC